MPVTINKTKCCGAVELVDISSVKGPLDILKAVIKDLITYRPTNCDLDHPPLFVTFTGVTKRESGDHASSRKDDYGQAFANFLVDNGLGGVVSTPAMVNFTENTIRLWVWTPDHGNLLGFMRVRE